jgi:hypothetical protein
VGDRQGRQHPGAAETLTYDNLNRMRSAVRVIVSVVAVMSLSGCRQADGPVPTPNAGRQEELNDVARDLQYIASGTEPDGPEYLADDLRKYARERAVPAVDELARRTASAVAGTKLADETAQRLSHSLWVSVSARELSERQIEGLQNDMQSMLVSIGAAEDRAQLVAAQVGEVQRAVTDRPRRWYELF